MEPHIIKLIQKYFYFPYLLPLMCYVYIDCLKRQSIVINNLFISLQKFRVYIKFILIACTYVWTCLCDIRCTLCLQAQWNHGLNHVRVSCGTQEVELRTDMLQQHAAFIGGTNAATCPLCHKFFLGGEALVEHMKLHHKDPPSGVTSKFPIFCYYDIGT